MRGDRRLVASGPWFLAAVFAFMSSLKRGIRDSLCGFWSILNVVHGFCMRIIGFCFMSNASKRRCGMRFTVFGTRRDKDL